MYSLLTHFLKHHFDLTDELIATLLDRVKPYSVPRKTLLVSAGDVCQHYWFVTKGCLRAYQLKPNGTESTRIIAVEGKICNAFTSFLTQKPSVEYVEALENTDLLGIHYDDVYALLEAYPAYEKPYRQLLEHIALRDVRRIESLTNLTAAERFEAFQQHKPQLMKRLPNRIIASYLGIAPESLSRIRADNKKDNR
jgi:CRP-like cAMP-binding protein